MTTHTVSFEIDVNAESPAAACRRAWALLTSPDSMLPVGTVITHASYVTEDIDLQELAELWGVELAEASTPTCNLQPAT